MKYFVILLFSVLVPFIGFAQTEDSIIEKHIKLIGDAPLWAKIKTIQINGKILDGSTVVIFKKKIIPSKFMRMDYSFDTRNSNYQNKKYFILITPTEAWKLAPDDTGTIAKMNAQEVAFGKEEMDYEDPFVNAIQKGIKITRLGDEFFNEQNHYKYHVTFPSGKNYYYYINSKSLFIVKRILVDQDLTEIIEYKSYEKTKLGITLPKQILQKEMEYIIEEIKFNENIPAATFKL